MSLKWFFGGGALFIALVAVAAFTWNKQHSKLSDESRCPVSAPTEPGKGQILDIGRPSGEPKLSLSFDSKRGVKRTGVSWETPAGVTPPDDVSLTISPLVGPEGFIDTAPISDNPLTERISARTVFGGGRTTVTLCFDARQLPEVDHGQYLGSLATNDERVERLLIPVEVNFQSHYLWWGIPIGAAVFILSLWLVWTTFETQTWPRRVVTAATALGAIATVFISQGMENPTWGGPRALGVLTVAMYTAATGATATVAKGAEALASTPGGKKPRKVSL